MKKKLLTIVAVILAAAALVVGSVAGTVAYLTASSAVSNVFTIGNVSLTLFEHKVNPEGQKVDSSGAVITSEGQTPVEIDTNSYHLMPNQKYTKNPTVRITSSDKMYLFIKSSNQIRTIESGNLEGATTEEQASTMRAQMEKNGWVEFVRSGDGIEIVWVYGQRGSDGVIHPTPVNNTVKQTPGATPGILELCESFEVGNIDDKTLALYAAAKVNFTAFAIQESVCIDSADTTNHVVTTAWNALKTTYPYEGGIINPVNPYSGSDTNPYEPVSGVDKPVAITPPTSSNP